MKILMVLNQQPYNGTDVTWNALRLTGQLKKDGADVRMFLMNDAVDLARNSTTAPEGSHDLVEMTKKLIASGVPVKVCGTCQARCGLYKGDPYYEGAEKATMADLSALSIECDKVLTF